MMKKHILNIGKALNKAEQKQITGGCNPGLGNAGCPCDDEIDCITIGDPFAPWICIQGFCNIG